jgi:dUTP pyrophosphatase
MADSQEAEIEMYTDEEEAIENDPEKGQKRQPGLKTRSKRSRSVVKQEDSCSENGDQDEHHHNALLLNRMSPLAITIENELATRNQSENSEPESINIILQDDEVVTFQKLRAKAMLPTRGSAGAVGFDLYSPIRVSLAPFERFTLQTHIAVKMPENTYGRIAPRSGLCAREGVTCLGGVIDPDYKGEIMVILINLDPTEPTSIKKGSRVAQLILERVYMPLRASPTHAYSQRGTKCLGEASGIY